MTEEQKEQLTQLIREMRSGEDVEFVLTAILDQSRLRSMELRAGGYGMAVGEWNHLIEQIERVEMPLPSCFPHPK